MTLLNVLNVLNVGPYNNLLLVDFGWLAWKEKLVLFVICMGPCIRNDERHDHSDSAMLKVKSYHV